MILSLLLAGMGTVATAQNINLPHDLYFVFKGGDIQKQNLFFLDWWKFSELLRI